MDQGGLALALAVVFLANLVPAFMPPTWAILATLAARGGLDVLPLAVGGAAAASAGRTLLALAARRWGAQLLPARRRHDLAEAGRAIEERARWAPAAGMLVFTLSPIPSNQLFIAAGIMRLRLAPLVAAFFAGRLVSYAFWVSTAAVVTGALGAIPPEGRIVLDVAFLAALGALALVDPRDVLRRLRGRGTADLTSGQASTDRRAVPPR